MTALGTTTTITASTDATPTNTTPTNTTGRTTALPTAPTRSEPGDRGAVFERKESAVRSYCRRIDVTFEGAAGSELVDTAGRRYLDFLAGAGSLNYGHNDPDLCAALVAHISSGGITHSLDLHTAAKARFLEALDRHVLAPRDMAHRVQFPGPTGTNAVEAALKLARKVTGRSLVVAFTNGFHGVTLGALAATGNGALRAASHDLLGGVFRLPYDGYLGADVDTADLLERMLDDPSSGLATPAAVLFETVQGEGGINVASAAWLRRIEAICRQRGIVVVVDDVQAGCGRTGAFFSFEEAGLDPDLVVLSKSISGLGLPLALVLIRPELDVWAPGEHNGTFRGSNHSFVTATATLEKYWSDDALMVDVARRGELVASRLATMALDIPGATVRGRGMMRGLDVRSGDLAARIATEAFARGLVIETAGPFDEVVKVMAPLTTPDDQLADGLDRLADACRDALAVAGS